jgi:Ubiquitin carboxyl-terminal hydrolase
MDYALLGCSSSLTHAFCALSFPVWLTCPTDSCDSGPHHGHYIATVKCFDKWLVYDDERVDVIDELTIQSCFGVLHEGAERSNCGYLLFYREVGGKNGKR